jgi:hypothetical protein
MLAALENASPFGVGDGARSGRDARLGTLDLSTCVFAGTASWGENSDGKITLTNSNNFESGAAWYPRELPQVSAYDITWSFRVGPGDTAGDGITFAVLQTNAAPDNNYVGDDGNGLGLQGLSGTGYAVAIGPDHDGPRLAGLHRCHGRRQRLAQRDRQPRRDGRLPVI